MPALRATLAGPAWPSPGFLRRNFRRLRLIHPFPTLLNVAATAGLAFVAAGGRPPSARLAAMMLAMFAAQAAIGATNDYMDRDLDAGAKPWKPVVAGLVSPGAALVVGAALALVAVALGAAILPPAALTLLLVGLAAGLSYDVVLKRTWLSWLAFAVAIPTLPLWVWASLDAWRPALLLLIAPGALLGVSLHLANTLPDLDHDRRLGLRGFAHRLGKRRSLWLCWSSYAAALVIAVTLVPVLSGPLRFLPGLLAGVLALSIAAGLHARRRDDAALYAGWGLLAIGAAAIAVSWLAAL